ncbi:MAG TPA: hypothetical protein VJB38_14850 [Bacteroidota bacterium]|nr:hypothetical protein [Bacteroidota bacterium]
MTTTRRWSEVPLTQEQTGFTSIHPHALAVSGRIIFAGTDAGVFKGTMQ